MATNTQNEYKKFGIDISVWQAGIDFKKVKDEGVDFVIIKSSEGCFTDPLFERHYTEAKKYGFKVGAYHYLTSTTVSGAETEANYFSKILKGKQFDMPVYLDIESPSLFANAKQINTEIVKTFCSIMEKNKYWVGVYSYLDFFNYNLDDSKLQRYAHWIGSIGVSKPKTNCSDGVFGIWQYGGDRNLIRLNKVGGLVCDQDYCYIDYPTKIKERKLNGYDKVVQNPKAKNKEVAIDSFKVGDLVSIQNGAKYTNNVKVPDIIIKQRWYVSKIIGQSAVIDTNEAGTMRILSSIDSSYLIKEN